MRRVIKVITIFFFAILAFVSIYFIRIISKKGQITQETEYLKETVKNVEVNIDYSYVIKELCSSNLDWSKYPLTKNFINKYYDENGLFYDLRKNIIYDEIHNTTTYAKNSFYLYLQDTKNFYTYTMDVIYYLDENNKIDDMYFDTFELSDIGSAEMLTKHTITENNYCYVFQNLCRNVYNPELALLENYHEIDYVKTTKNFDKKYNKNDIYDTILEDCPIEANSYYYESNYEQRYVIIEAIFPDYYFVYRIDFVLDENRYLDDYKITEIKRVKEKYIYDEDNS